MRIWASMSSSCLLIPVKTKGVDEDEDLQLLEGDGYPVQKIIQAEKRTVLQPFFRYAGGDLVFQWI